MTKRYSDIVDNPTLRQSYLRSMIQHLENDGRALDWDEMNGYYAEQFDHDLMELVRFWSELNDQLAYERSMTDMV